METTPHTSPQEEFAIVERVARIVSSVRGTKPDYTRLAVELELAIPFDIFGIVLLRHDRQAVRVTVCQREEYGGATSWVAAHHQHPWESSMLEQVLQTPKLMVNEYKHGLDGPPAVCGDALSGYHQLHSTLIMPLMVEERILGTLELGTVASNTYTDKTLQRLVSAVARVLATAIEGVQLGGSTAIQDRQRQALKEVSSALTSKLDLPTILNQIVAGIAGSLNVTSAILLYDRRAEILRLEALAGLDSRTFEKMRTVAVREECILGYTLHHRQPSISYDLATDERFPANHAHAEELNIHSVYTFPLITGATVYGVLLLCSPEPGGLTPLKADILSLFASQATIAIHNSMLLESVRQRSQFQETIERLEQALHHTRECATTAIGAKDEVYELFAHVREETQRTFGVSFASLLHFISDHLLTRNEYDLQAIFSSQQDRAELFPNSSSSQTEFLLTQTAEAALVRAGMLGELSRLLVQLKQSTSWVKDAWFVADLNGQCLYMNPAAEMLCNVRMQDIDAAAGDGVSEIERVFEHVLLRIRNSQEVRSYLRDFTHGGMPRQEMRCVLALEPIHASYASFVEQEQGTSQTLESNTLLKSAPSDYHYSLVRYPLHDQQGQLIGNALQMRDVTEQVRDEKNRSALLSSVSHDLRTPLTTIKAAVTGLLQAGAIWSEQDRREMLEDVDSETDHLTVMVNALIEMSRIEMGALILEKEWCDVVEVVHGIQARLECTLAGRSIRLNLQPHLPLVYADHAQLERVFYNLTDNAARHSPENTEIIVAIDVVDKDVQEAFLPAIRVRVIDSGYGVPEHEHERIFRSFYGLRAYGSGLGLAICKGIVEAHRGHIWVESVLDDEGKPIGSCFVFTLPVHGYNAGSTEADSTSNAFVSKGFVFPQSSPTSPANASQGPMS